MPNRFNGFLWIAKPFTVWNMSSTFGDDMLGCDYPENSVLKLTLFANPTGTKELHYLPAGETRLIVSLSLPTTVSTRSVNGVRLRDTIHRLLLDHGREPLLLEGSEAEDLKALLDSFAEHDSEAIEDIDEDAADDMEAAADRPCFGL